jgi:uncharacterized RDD family membrane protein YckC
VISPETSRRFRETMHTPSGPQPHPPYGPPQQSPGMPLSPQYGHPPYWTPPHFHSPPLAPGSFFLRFLAKVIDDILVVLLTGGVILLLWALGLLTGFAAAREFGAVAAGFLLWMVTIPAAVFTYFAYHIRFETGPGQATPGKKLFGLKIVNQYGGPIGAGQAIGRLLSMVFLSSLFLGVGYFLALVTEKKQALHDLVAGTQVVKA